MEKRIDLLLALVRVPPPPLARSEVPCLREYPGLVQELLAQSPLCSAAPRRQAWHPHRRSVSSSPFLLAHPWASLLKLAFEPGSDALKTPPRLLFRSSLSFLWPYRPWLAGHSCPGRFNVVRTCCRCRSGAGHRKLRLCPLACVRCTHATLLCGTSLRSLRGYNLHRSSSYSTWPAP